MSPNRKSYMCYRKTDLRALSVRTIVAAILLAGASCAVAFADQTAPTIPAGTRLKFHVLAPIASNESKTGETFAFALLTPVVLGDRSIPADGTTGSGTIYLAGHAGSAGHEGDLTLRLDSLHTPDGHVVVFADQRFQINGRNRKVTAGLLGFIPYAGIGARLIRGSDVRVDATTPIETVLTRPATITNDSSLAPTPLPSAS